MRQWIGAILLLAALQSQAWAAERPVAVSPGHASTVLSIEARCPTFSWTSAERAVPYELVVYRLEDEEEAVEVLRERVPAGASAWTPPLGRCLDPASRYAWSVRAASDEAAGGEPEAGAWSQPALFRVADQPSVGEIRAALELLARAVAAEQEPRRGAAASAPPAPMAGERPRELAREQRGAVPLGSGPVYTPTYDDAGMFTEHPAGSANVVGVHSLIRDSSAFDSWRVGVIGEVRDEGLGGSFLGWGVWGLVTTPAGEGVRGEAYTDPPQGSATGVAGFSNAPSGRAGYFEANNDAKGVVISHITNGDLALDVGGDSEFHGDVAIDDGLTVGGWNQVIAVGELTATATCPMSQVIVFGLHWHMTTSGDADDSAFGGCTPGQTQCSVTATGTAGEDEVRVWMVCSPQRAP